MSNFHVDIDLSGGGSADEFGEKFEEFIHDGCLNTCDSIAYLVKATAESAAPARMGVGRIINDDVDDGGNVFSTEVYATGHQAPYVEYGAGYPAATLVKNKGAVAGGMSHPLANGNLYVQHPENFIPQSNGSNTFGWIFQGRFQQGWPSYHFMWDGYQLGKRYAEQIAKEEFG